MLVFLATHFRLVSDNFHSATWPALKPFRKGWAKGECTQFLDESYHGYQGARARGGHSVTDYLTTVVNAYCARFTWWLDPPNHLPWHVLQNIAATVKYSLQKLVATFTINGLLILLGGIVLGTSRIPPTSVKVQPSIVIPCRRQRRRDLNMDLMRTRQAPVRSKWT